MGGVSRPDPWGIGQGVGAVGAVGSPAEVPQAPPRPEEAQAQATERGEGQACRHREDSKSPSYVYKLTHPRGWDEEPHEMADDIQGHQDRGGHDDRERGPDE